MCADLGVEVPYSKVVEYFNYLFLDQGMIHRERWMPRDGLLDRLRAKFELAIFTGRTTEEAEITLNRERVRDRFLLMTASNVEREKPAPDGLLKIASLQAVEEIAVRRRHGRRRALCARGQRSVHRNRRAGPRAPRHSA